MKIRFLIKPFLLIIGLHSGLQVFAEYVKLDSVINMRAKMTENKENKLEELKNIYNNSLSDLANLNLLEMIYEEYKNYNYDSATYYADNIYLLAEEMENEDYKANSLIHVAWLNVKDGNLEVGEQILDEIYPEELGEDILKEYNRTRYLLYLGMRDASTDNTLREEYQNLMEESIEGMLEHTEKGTVEYYYGIAEKLRLVENKNDSSLKYYLKVIEQLPRNTELYAKSAYSLAQYYKQLENNDLYKEWLIKSAISEMEIPIKGSKALEELALLIYDHEPDNINKATDYLLLVSEDALSYNSGMGIRDVPEKLPFVLPAYLRNIKERDFNFHISVILLVIFIAFLAVLMVFMKRQQAEIKLHKGEIDDKEKELKILKDRMIQKNMEISRMNKNLELTSNRYNKIHNNSEQLWKVWMDMSTLQANRLKNYKSIVKEKVKSQKPNDLIDKPNFRSSVEEDDAQILLERFDKAFLEIYPDFIDEINKLLKENCQFIIKPDDALTTELRICALIKLGVKDSSEMADLLFASTQTIYNNRSRLRNRAIDKSSFENQIATSFNYSTEGLP